jgi:hypothetical protein
MLAFIEHLVEWSTDVCIVVVCTSRPQLFEGHPHWAGGLANATTLSLRPLSADETRPLVGCSWQRVGRPRASSIRSSIGAAAIRSSPRYTPLIERDVQALSGLAMPDTIHAVISARIDTRDGDRNRLLQDAAVIGKMFWSGALATITECDVADVRRELHDLVVRTRPRRRLLRYRRVPGRPRPRPKSARPIPNEGRNPPDLRRVSRGHRQRAPVPDTPTPAGCRPAGGPSTAPGCPSRLMKTSTIPGDIDGWANARGVGSVNVRRVNSTAPRRRPFAPGMQPDRFRAVLPARPAMSSVVGNGVPDQTRRAVGMDGHAGRHRNLLV